MKVKPPIPVPNLKYTTAIDRLIPPAEKKANELVGPKPTSSREERALWAARWDRTFHSIMDDLALSYGLRLMSHQVINE